MRRPSRALRGAAPLAAAFLLLAGCARETPDVQDVRQASNRYLKALVRKDVDQVKRSATTLVSMASIVGGRVIEIGPAVGENVGVLDSLLEATDRQRARADSLWKRADDADADSLFRLVRLLNRRYVTLRLAQRAAHVSLPESLLTTTLPIELRRVRVRIRFAGDRVGPKPVDREMILRLLRAGRGDWIVFSLYLPSEDPFPRLD
jgi:hypothetical protein